MAYSDFSVLAGAAWQPRSLDEPRYFDLSLLGVPAEYPPSWRVAEVTRWSRPADLPGPLRHFDHEWLKTDTQEAGMGGADGNVPAQQGNSAWPYSQTQTVDHTGESKASNARQLPIDFPVDEACVNRLIAPGRKTGPWTPWNQCKTFTFDVLDQCRIGPKPLWLEAGP